MEADVTVRAGRENVNGAREAGRDWQIMLATSYKGLAYVTCHVTQRNLYPRFDQSSIARLVMQRTSNVSLLSK